MHDTAHLHGRLFFELYWQPEFRTVAELGSYDVNGRLRDHAPPGARWIGLDMAPGPGVDAVVAAGAPLPLADASVDVAVTSSAFEHDIAFWDSFLDLVRILRPGGLLYVNAPSNYAVHRYPLDCWRFYPDAGLALCDWAARRSVGVALAESFIGRQGGEGWCDFVAVFRKDGPGALQRRGRIADQAPAVNVLDGGAGMPPRREAERAETDEMLAIAALRADLAGQAAKLAAQEQTLLACTDGLAERDGRIAGLTARLATTGHSRAALEERLVAAEAALAAVEARLGAAGQALADATGRAAAQDTALAAARAEAAAAAAHLRRILASRSWRLTGPLRSGLSWLRRGG